MLHDKNNRGQTLVPALGITLALTLTAALITINLVKERREYFIKNQRDDLSFAVKSSEKIALASLTSKLTQEFKTKLENWNETNDEIMSDNEASALASSLSASSPYILTEQRDSSTTLKTNNGQKIYTFYVPWDDKDKNTNKDPGESGVSFIKQEFVNNGLEKIWRYYYSFSLTSYAYIGSLTSKKNTRKIVTTGNIVLNASPKNLAEYALLMDKSSGAYLGSADTIDGPVHTNQRLYLYGNNNGAVFKSRVTQVEKTVNWYYNGSPSSTSNSGDLTPTGTVNGVPVNVGNIKYTVSGVDRVKPTFTEGLTVNVGKIDLPQSTKNMERIALGMPLDQVENMTPMGTSEKIAKLGLGGSSVPENIYIPNNGTNVTGGIYVNGDVESLIMSVDGTNQVYEIKQSSSSKRTRITVDRVNGRTKVEQMNYTTGAVTSTTNYDGNPRGSLHVEGKINSLGGKPRPTGTPNDPNTSEPALEKGNKLTISATSTIRIDRDMKYQDDPRVNPDAVNMLGLISDDKVMIKDPAPKDITIHGIIMTGKNNVGTFGVENYNTRIRNGAIHLLGGQIIDSLSPTENSSLTKGYGTDSVYDKRASKGQAPPFFPRGDVEQKSPTLTIGSAFEQQDSTN